MPFRIAQISDTHLSRTKPFFVSNFNAVAEALRASKPDLVINTGDLSLNGAEEADDLAFARECHDSMGLRWRALPGNHDLGDSIGLPHPVDAARRGRYVAEFAGDFWRVDIPGWRLIGLNAQTLGSDLAAEQEAFTAAAAAVEGRAVALFIHKPLCDRDLAEEAVGGRFLNPEPRGKLLQSLGNCRPALIACGHVHQYRSSIVAGQRHVWAPSTAFIIPDSRQPRYGDKTVGYVEHVFYQDGRHESRLVPVGAIRNIADFPEAYPQA